MPELKPQSASEFDSETTQLIVRTTLHLATILGDFQDELVLVGGMVPYFLIDQEKQPYDARHIGSQDVDLGLHIALLHEERYEGIANRLKAAGFEPDKNSEGHRTRQRWRRTSNRKAVVEFLMDTECGPNNLQNLTDELAALIKPGIRLAFRDKLKVRLSDHTLDGADATREFFVCGPGALLVMKALAFQDRSYRKDAYDIHYIAQCFGAGPSEVADHIRSLLDDPVAKNGLKLLRENFETQDSNGPILLAKFFQRDGDQEFRADISGIVMEVVRQCE